MDASFLKKVWYLTNIINVVCYMIMTVGYILLRKPREKAIFQG